uniref:Uncharacterized protein n=1 Tax=Anguilla anguilla TaxID=7936 RepID=A0A0E9T9Y7_ANGAN
MCTVSCLLLWKCRASACIHLRFDRDYGH